MKTPEEIIKMVKYRINELEHSPHSMMHNERHLDSVNYLRNKAIDAIREYRKEQELYLDRQSEKERLINWLGNLKQC
jgi:hypothetical protein